jgi:hypothetical protein
LAACGVSVLFLAKVILAKASGQASALNGNGIALDLPVMNAPPEIHTIMLNPAIIPVRAPFIEKIIISPVLEKNNDMVYGSIYEWN